MSFCLTERMQDYYAHPLSQTEICCGWFTSELLFSPCHSEPDPDQMVDLHLASEFAMRGRLFPQQLHLNNTQNPSSLCYQFKAVLKYSVLYEGLYKHDLDFVLLKNSAL